MATFWNMDNPNNGNVITISHMDKPPSNFHPEMEKLYSLFSGSIFKPYSQQYPAQLKP
jgi:hypothetical protein